MFGSCRKCGVDFEIAMPRRRGRPPGYCSPACRARRASKAAGDLFDALAADADRRPVIFACVFGDRLDALARSGDQKAIDILIKMRPPDVPAAIKKRYRNDALRSIHARLQSRGVGNRKSAVIVAAAFARLSEDPPPHGLPHCAPFDRLAPDELRVLENLVRQAIDELGGPWPNWRQTFNIVQF